MNQRKEDLELLSAVLASDKLGEDDRAAFGDMLGRMETYEVLTTKQREYVRGVGERLEILMEYKNEVSSGKVPRGNEVTLLVRDKPLRPPGRRT